MKKKTDLQFKQEVYDLVKDEYTILGNYINNKTKIKIRHNCNLCNNYEFEMRPNDFLNGYRCPKCSIKNKNYNRKTDLQFKQEVKDLVGDEYTVLGNYINNKTKIKIKHNCNLCNNYEYDVSPDRFLSGDRCPFCANLKRSNIISSTKKTIDEFKQEVKELVGDEYTVLSDQYINNKTKIKIRHNSNLCNNYEYEIRPNDFQQGFRCPKCNLKRQSSLEELELLNYIKSIYKLEIIESDRSLLQGQELDILINNEKIAFEFDGLYWHSEINGKDKNYHLNKTNECIKKGYQLIHIFEDEWNNKQEIVKAKIRYLLKNTNLPKIYARNCYVKEITDSKIKNEFLNNNHIQGEDRSNIKLGLYTKNENKLVSVMTFCNPRIALGQKENSKYDGELSRFASDINYIVVGGFSKLWKYFEREYDWNRIITYADKRWSNGNLYIKNGWTHIHDSKPNYWYCLGNKRYYRYKFRKSELKKLFPNIYKDDLTEFQIMDKTNYTRIWDCGNMVFEFNR